MGIKCIHIGALCWNYESNLRNDNATLVRYQSSIYRWYCFFSLLVLSLFLLSLVSLMIIGMVLILSLLYLMFDDDGCYCSYCCYCYCCYCYYHHYILSISLVSSLWSPSLFCHANAWCFEIKWATFCLVFLFLLCITIGVIEINYHTVTDKYISNPINFILYRSCWLIEFMRSKTISGPAVVNQQSDIVHAAPPSIKSILSKLISKPSFWLAISTGAGQSQATKFLSISKFFHWDLPRKWCPRSYYETIQLLVLHLYLWPNYNPFNPLEK